MDEHEYENENNVWRDAVRIGEFTYQYNCVTGVRRVLKERDYDQGWVTVWRGGNTEDMPPEPKDLRLQDTTLRNEEEDTNIWDEIVESGDLLEEMDK